VVVGLSGGADSVVLLYLLHRLGYECVAAHCNFHLRGEESARDEAFARQLAASLDISFYKQDFDTYAIAKERGISIEMAARDLRYAWFEVLRKNLRADAIAVAHHKDDSIETLLLNLIRGTGIKGLTGIKPQTGCVVRPLLCVSKQEILRFAEKKELAFITDSSNLQDEFTRNKIRNQILPLLETINPAVREALTQTMNNLDEAVKIYDAEIEKACQHVFDKEKGSIDMGRLKSFPSPESVLFELLKAYGFGKEVVREIHRAIDSQPGKEFYSEKYRLVRDRTAFLLLPLNKQEEKEYLINIGETFFEIPFQMKQICLINTKEDEKGIAGQARNDRSFRMQIDYRENEKDFKIERNKQTACLDYNKLQFPLTLRKWRIGDKFVPFGMNSFQKLSDFFNNNKFSKPEKEKTWLLVSGENIVWIVNHRIDDRFKVTDNTKKMIILKLL
jgi:tRNA(Ile)-lysidine synthase